MSDLFVDLESERMVLGAVVVDNAAMNALAGILVPKHFVDPKHQALWDAMLALYQRAQPIDYLTIRNELADRLEQAGGMAYISGLDDGMPRVTNPEQWAKHVIEKARRRAAKHFAAKFLEEINDSGFETEDLLERHQENLTRLQQARRDGVVVMRDVLPHAMKLLDAFSQSDDGLIGIPCGLPDIDRMLGGWQDGSLVIVAARPGRGKSVFMAQAAIHAASRKRQVLYIGMEMKPAATVVRMILNTAAVDRWDLRKRAGSEGKTYFEAWGDVAKAAGALRDFGIWFDERESPTVAQIKALAKQHQASRGCDLLIVDYLQRCELPKGEDQWKAVGDIAKNLKSLAQALNIPILAACQLGAEAEDCRPTKQHLAQARQVIGAEADVIAFLHPPALEDWRSQKSDAMTFIVDKQRDGPTGEIALSFERRKVRFVPAGPQPGEW